MVDSIKITALSNIGANLSFNSLLPVVNMNGTPVTQKANLQILGNYILSQAGGPNFVQAAQATLAQSVTNAAQPNITSVGTLTSLTVSGNVDLSSLNIDVGNLHVSGGTNGYVLQTDGAGNLSWTAQTGGGGGNGSPGGANTQVQFNDAGSFGGNSGFTYDKTTNMLSVANVKVNTLISDSSSGSNVNINANGARFKFSEGGALYWPAPPGIVWAIEPNIDDEFEIHSHSNVVISTDTANANLHFTFDSTGNFVMPANTIAMKYANGSAIFGNIVGSNLDGNSSNILYGNGVFAAAPAAGGYGNSNVATFLANYGSNTISTTGNVTVGNIIGNGQALTGINGSNITGTVANANYSVYSGTASTADSVAGANVTGAVSYATTANSVALANVSGAGNIASINLTGSTSNVLYGNGVFAPITVTPAGSNTQIQFNDNGTLAGNVNLTFNKTTSTLDVNGPLIAGNGSPLGGLTNPIIAAIGNVDNYTQVYNWNASNTANASSDFIAYPSNGTDASGWIDVGITSNAFTQAAYSVTQQNEGYVFMSAPSGSGRSGNLVIATDSTGTTNSIEFYIGGFNQTKGGATRKMLITSTGANVTGTLGVTGNITGGNLSGSLVTGTLTTAAQPNITSVGTLSSLTVSGNVSAGNVSVTGNVSGNTNGFAIGYRDIPQVSFTGNATLALTDAGKHYYGTLSTANTLTVPNNASIAFSTGATINIINQGTGNILVNAASGVTMYLAGNSTSANRTLTSYGVATLTKVATDTWFIAGVGLV